MQPGDICEYDFRDQSRSPHSPRSDAHTAISVLQWNIERGCQLDKVIDILQSARADIICLQELDIDCARSDNRNCALEIARTLRMKCVFVCEFIELKSTVRRQRDQGGGYHGNAVLSRFDLIPRVLLHQYQAFNWERDGLSKREPRMGARYTLVMEVHAPGFTQNNTRGGQVDKILVYSVHLEVFCGILARVAQLSEILADASRNKEQYPCQLICGDLNTMAHGIARFSPSYCTDGMRWRSLGRSEAEWLTDRVLTVLTDDAPFNTHLLSLSLPSDVVQNARNPGFYDPFDPSVDITLASYGGYYSGKLDWTLCMGVEASGMMMGNDHYEASDHKYLRITIREDCEERACKRFVRQWKKNRRGTIGGAFEVGPGAINNKSNGNTHFDNDDNIVAATVAARRIDAQNRPFWRRHRYWWLSTAVIAVSVVAYWRRHHIK